ncbi:MAG TPA: MOSC domain-containing protein [Xanthobacteraceae bacterium]|nr:MOSC domain-containing protein [Xanthobacteraceae bacterium]
MRIASLYRYPVKGLSGERLPTVELGRHQTFPNDRAYALENGPSGFDPFAPSWQPKIKFLCLMKNARLAALDTRFDDGSETLTVRRGCEVLLQEDLSRPEGRKAVENFFENFMENEKRGPIRLLQSPGHSFSDLAKKVVSLINLATLKELETRLGQPVHPLRFRANIYFDGLPAWSEHKLLGETLELGGARAKVIKTTSRCAATEVNPETAHRDIPIPAILLSSRDSLDLGIYAEIETPGRIAEGDALTILR